MAFDNVDRLHCFSLGDFRNFERCYFDFLVKHHLQKRYEIEEGNQNQAIGSLLDLVIKIIHRAKAYNQPLDYILTSIFKAAENEIRSKAARQPSKSFYSAATLFLTEETINKAKAVFTRYYNLRKGKINRVVVGEKFWECMLEGPAPDGTGLLKLWGGPDALEMGDDGIVEIVDYKFFENPKKGKENLDMDLMPKLYSLLCAQELLKSGHTKARFRVRSWTDPEDESLYEEFDLENIFLLKDFFRQKIEKILSVTELNFCERDYCKSCKSDQREAWLKQLQTQFNLS